MFRRVRAPRVPWTLALIAALASSWVGTPAAQLASPEDRFTAAMAEADSVCRDWCDAPASTERPDAARLVDVASTMQLEATATSAGIRSCVRAAFGEAAEDAAFRDGLVRYLQSLAVERLFDARYRRLAYAQHAEALVGGFVDIPVRGIYRTRLTVLRQGDDAAAWPIARGFMTLERRLGLPRLQRAVRAAARDGSTAPVVATMEAALGQSLQGFFDDLAASREFDFAVTAFTSEAVTCDGRPCDRTRVVVERRGATSVPGRLNITVAFADGDTAQASWDGQATPQELWWHSASPALSVSLDPGDSLVVDRNLLDDFTTRAPTTNVDVMRWMGQWAVWLQHALLTSAYFF